MQNLEQKNKTIIKTITAVKKQRSKLCQQNTLCMFWLQGLLRKLYEFLDYFKK